MNNLNNLTISTTLVATGVELLSNEEHVALVEQYQATYDDFIFTDLLTNLHDVILGLAMDAFHKSKGLKKSQQEFMDVAILGLYKAIEKFDGSQGSNFVAFVTKYVKYTISTEIFRTERKKDNEFFKASKYLDHVVNSEGTTFADTLSASEIGTDVDAVFNDAFADLEQSSDLISDLKELIIDFADSAKGNDGDIVKTVFSVILTPSDVAPTAKVVNEALYSAFPEVAKATIRKQKSRALTKFTTFATDCGFATPDLSQF